MATARFDTARYVFTSAGTNAVAGQPATEHAGRVAAERGLDIAGHEATTLDTCEAPDTVFGMEQHHLIAVRQRFPELDISRIRLLGHPVAIVDPFGRDLEQYRLAAERIDRALESIDLSGLR